MLSRVLGWLLGVPVALVVVVFAIANRHAVRLDLWPLPWALDLPLYLAVLGALAVGIAIGMVAAWLAGAGARRRARQERRRAEALERQLDAARAEAKLKGDVAGPTLPAPPADHAV